VLHGLVVAAALGGLLCLPCLLTLLIFADSAVHHAEDRVVRLTGRWRGWREAVRLERGTGLAPAARARLLPWPGGPRAAPAGPPFEEVAADLRRLSRQRAEVAPRSRVWFVAVHRAYDERLRIACRELEIPEYLQELDGIDLEIERLRVEGLLEAAGVRLATVDGDGRQDAW
jgi:hypothetical protein